MFSGDEIGWSANIVDLSSYGHVNFPNCEVE
jgi:hypothetical protein